jgi:hypothetical protein
VSAPVLRAVRTPGGSIARVVACRCRTRLAAARVGETETVHSAAAVMWLEPVVERRCRASDGFRLTRGPEAVGTTL